MKKFLLAAMACAFFTQGLRAEDDGAYEGSVHFRRMKNLAGKWVGPDPEKRKKSILVEYEVTSGGRALVEKIYSGTSREIVSVYFDKDRNLNVIRHGMLPTPSPLEFRYDKDDEFTLILPIGSGVKPDDFHLHEIAVKFTDPDHVIQRWTYYEFGKLKESETLALARMREKGEPVRQPDHDAKHAAQEEQFKKQQQAEDSRRLAEAEKARKKEEADSALRQAADAERIKLADEVRKALDLSKTKKAEEAEQARQAEEAFKTRGSQEAQRAAAAEKIRKDKQAAENAKKTAEADRLRLENEAEEAIRAAKAKEIKQEEEEEKAKEAAKAERARIKAEEKEAKRAAKEAAKAEKDAEKEREQALEDAREAKKNPKKSEPAKANEAKKEVKKASPAKEEEAEKEPSEGGSKVGRGFKKIFKAIVGE
ncbi:MAG: hypothetical protein A2901_05425 [Elusimicrobia bacterium RIFCSPLOWO2_01_FULL_54_10]|nr:MAG: hypothetical protein A2901_05425 [Elusimicrobia bacterium RIFCSPLOWO2_01_FULL_54_10]